MINNNFGRSTWLAIGLIMVTAAMSWNPVSAQQAPEPSAVIALASVDDQLNDLEYLAAATSEMAGNMSGMARLQAEGFLPGVDFKKASGALLYFVEGKTEPNAIGFFPVTNLEDVLDKISEFAEIEEDSDVINILPDNGEQLSLKSQGNYAFVSDKPELLENLPADPGSLITEQAGKYNVSAVVYPQRIPAELRDQALALIRQGFEAQLDQLDDLQASIQEAQFDMQMKQMEMMVNEFERVTIGLDIDKPSERVYLDVNMKGVDNSDMSRRLIASKTTKPTKFAGFLMDNAAMTMHNCSGMSKEDAKTYIDSFENMRDVMLDEIVEEEEEDKAAVLTKITNQLSGVIKKTLESGLMDMGGVIFTNDGLNATFAAQIADARSLESSIKEIVSESQSKLDEEGVVFNLNAGSHSGFNLHKISIELPEDELDDAVIDMFGEKVNLILGINDSQVYIAAGKNPEATLKKSIDANSNASSTKPKEIGQYNFFLAPMMKMAASMQEEEMLEAMSDEISENGKDRVRMSYDVVNGEMRFRLEVQDGIFAMSDILVNTWAAWLVVALISKFTHCQASPIAKRNEVLATKY